MGTSVVAKPSRSPQRQPPKSKRAKVTPRTPRKTPGLTSDELLREAVRLVDRAEGNVAASELVGFLASRHGLTHDVVLEVIASSRALRRVGQRITRSSAVNPRTVVPPPREPWGELVIDVASWLNDLATDCIRVNVPIRSAALQLRFDFVRTDHGAEIWLAAYAPTPLLLAQYVRQAPWTLTPGGRLPLIAAGEDLEVPAVVVWRETAPAAAAARLRNVLEGSLRLDADRVHLDRDECTPLELERRQGDQATIRHLRQRRASSPALTTCHHCGHPLSDPVSVRLGIGPECRSSYSTEVLTAIQSKKPTTIRQGSVKPKEWLRTITADWLRTDC